MLYKMIYYSSFPLEQYDAYYIDRESSDKGDKVMYLTFDCGYENGYTDQMLDEFLVDYKRMAE